MLNPDRVSLLAQVLTASADVVPDLLELLQEK